MSNRNMQSTVRLATPRMNPASHVLSSSFSYASIEGVDPISLMQKALPQESGNVTEQAEPMSKNTRNMKAPNPIGISPRIESARQSALLDPEQISMRSSPNAPATAVPQQSYGPGEHAMDVAPIGTGRRQTQRELEHVGVPMGRNIAPGIQRIDQPDSASKTERITNPNVPEANQSSSDMKRTSNLRPGGQYQRKERLASTLNNFEPGLNLWPKTPETPVEVPLFNPYDERNPMKNTWSFVPLKPNQKHSVVGEMGAGAGLRAEARRERGQEPAKQQSALFIEDEPGFTKKSIWDEDIVKKALSRR